MVSSIFVFLFFSIFCLFSFAFTFAFIYYQYIFSLSRCTYYIFSVFSVAVVNDKILELVKLIPITMKKLGKWKIAYLALYFSTSFNALSFFIDRNVFARHACIVDKKNGGGEPRDTSADNVSLTVFNTLGRGGFGKQIINVHTANSR